MPLYDFRNKQTGDVEEHLVKISNLEQFSRDYPHLERVVSAAAFSDRVNIRHKIDSGFKEVLTKAKNAHPLGTIDV